MRLYFAGGESMHKVLYQVGVTSVLTSYFFLRRKSDYTLKNLVREFPHLFLDSGAFSFSQEAIKRGLSFRDIPKLPEVQDYLVEYANYVKKNGHHFEVVANLDVGGEEDKERFQRYLEEKTGRYILPVVHPSDSWDWVDKVFRTYPYVGLGGVGSERDTMKILAYARRRVAHARRYGTRVHMFAITVISALRLVPAFSADSSSWTTGGKYGVTFWFDGRTLRMWDFTQKHVRRRFKPQVEELGLSFEKFVKDHSRTVDLWNAYQWARFAQYLENVPYKKLVEKEMEAWRSRKTSKLSL